MGSWRTPKTYNTVSTHRLSVDQKTAKQVCAQRGFANLKDWRTQNRQAHAGFNARLNRKNEDKARLQSLMDALDKDYDIYLKGNV